MGVSPFFGVCFIADKTLGYTRFAFYTRIPTPPIEAPPFYRIAFAPNQCMIVPNPFGATTAKV